MSMLQKPVFLRIKDLRENVNERTQAHSLEREVYSVEKNKKSPLYKGKISIREGEFEKAVSVFAEIGRKIDFSKSQNIAIAYKPNEKTVISFFEAE